MENVLGIYCRFARWQGGTFDQALRDFKKRTRPEQDRFCSRVMHALDSKNLADVENAREFFRARI